MYLTPLATSDNNRMNAVQNHCNNTPTTAESKGRGPPAKLACGSIAAACTQAVLARAHTARSTRFSRTKFKTPQSS